MSNAKIDEILAKLWCAVDVEDVEEGLIDIGEIDDAKQAMYNLILEEVIGELEYRETEDMSLKTWLVEGLKAFGRNELRNEQQQRLNKLFKVKGSNT